MYGCCVCVSLICATQTVTGAAPRIFVHTFPSPPEYYLALKIADFSQLCSSVLLFVPVGQDILTTKVLNLK